MKSVVLAGTVVVEVEQAVLIDFGGDNVCWVPKSQILGFVCQEDGTDIVFNEGDWQEWKINQSWATAEKLWR